MTIVKIIMFCGFDSLFIITQDDQRYLNLHRFAVLSDCSERQFPSMEKIEVIGNQYIGRGRYVETCERSYNIAVGTASMLLL